MPPPARSAEAFGDTDCLSTVLPRHNGGENYLAEPKLLILTKWRFVIGGSLRIIKFMAIYNWRNDVDVAVDHTSKAGSLGDSGEDPQQREYRG